MTHMDLAALTRAQMTLAVLRSTTEPHEWAFAIDGLVVPAIWEPGACGGTFRGWVDDGFLGGGTMFLLSDGEPVLALREMTVAGPGEVRFDMGVNLTSSTLG